MLGEVLSYGMMVCDTSYDMTIHWMKSQQYIMKKDNEMFQQQHKIGIIGFTWFAFDKTYGGIDIWQNEFICSIRYCLSI